MHALFLRLQLCVGEGLRFTHDISSISSLLAAPSFSSHLISKQPCACSNCLSIYSGYRRIAVWSRTVTAALWVPVIWHKTAHASLGGGIFRAWWALTTRWNKSDYSVLMFFGDLVQLISHCPNPIAMANAFLRLKTCLIHDATDITCTARVSWLILQQSLYMSSMSSRRHRSKYINYRYRWTFLQFGCAPATL